MYELVFKESVKKDFRGIEKSDRKKILEKIKKLSQDPRPVGCAKLTNREEYRIRIRRFRVLYEIKDKKLIIVVVKIAHRKNIYN